MLMVRDQVGVVEQAQVVGVQVGPMCWDQVLVAREEVIRLRWTQLPNVKLTSIHWKDWRYRTG